MCYARRQRSSWARIKLSNKLYILRLQTVRFVWAIYSSFLYFFRVVFSLVLTDFVFALAFLLCTSFICCSIVKFQSALFARACLLYHFRPHLSRGFSKVFSIFFNFFSRAFLRYLLLRRSRGNSYILPHTLPFVNTFFEKNSIFCLFVTFDVFPNSLLRPF